MTAYYNEFDPFASAWLRNLVAAGHIAHGDVDSRSIVDVQPEDLEGRNETHFFAGIGVWSRALRDAGWPTARVPIWTGSAPCQPFSNAGRQQGSDDERHLWPVWFRLVDECRPPVILGEQVASKPAVAWFDALCADLEGAGYSVGAVDMCAAGLGAPHIRQRLWWVAVRRDFDGLADAGSDGPQGRVSGGAFAGRSMVRGSPRCGGAAYGSSATDGAWRDTDWIACRDGKWRPVEPGTPPLVDGATNRVGRLRGYGNAIALPVATWWVSTVMDVLGLRGAP